MNKNLFSLILVISISFAARAQYIAIPDTGFGSWMSRNGYASCLTGSSAAGWQADTTCSMMLNAITLRINSSQISDLTGVQYFKSLDTLYYRVGPLSMLPAVPQSLRALAFYSTSLTTLPALPAGLKLLNCLSCHLTALPALPDSLTWLGCQSNSISSLPALPDSLKYLYCDEDSLTSLPALPASLLTLSCTFNKITVLPALPSSLSSLSCDVNRLPMLPALPPSLTVLSAGVNLLTSLPVLPAGLTNLSCNGNSLITLPALPASLLNINCGSNSITGLPALPAALQSLNCGQNILTSLPTLPASLKVLYCEGNHLTGLPALPDSLDELDCSGNQLTAMPALPDSLTYLVCRFNTPLSSLPALPPLLNTLLCGSTHLSMLPPLPDSINVLDLTKDTLITCLPRIYRNSLSEFYIKGSGIQCLPNRFSAAAFDINPDTMPLCTPASGCDFYYNIAGNVHNDTSASCAQDSLDPGPLLKNVKVLLKENNMVVQQFYTFSSGGYSFLADSLVSYDITVDTSQIPLYLACPLSDVRTASLSISDSTALNENFGMVCAGSDYGVQAISGYFYPGLRPPLHIIAGNLTQLRYGVSCGSGSSGTVTTIYSGPVTYIEPDSGALTPSSVSGNTLSYNIADLNTLQPASLAIILSTDSNASGGDLVCITTIVTPSVPDANPSDDTMIECFEVLNSFDPNMKQAYPFNTVDTGRQWLTYTIHFQNTGNDTAYTVIVKDTLSQYLDAASFQYLASSNKAVIQLLGNAMVFTFPKINLPDSMTNPTASQGWIQYKVKTLSNLPIGTQIKNTASIYFDLNPAVVTNTTVNTVTTNVPTAIQNIQTPLSILLHPNPNSGTFTLETSGAIGAEYTITDMIGRQMGSAAITSDRQTIDVSLSPGVYQISVRSRSGAVSTLRYEVVR